MRFAAILFFVIITEGYIVLSSELLAIRQTTPFIGNGTDTVSIIIAAVLMPLAVGYFIGGRFKPGFTNGQYMSVRKKLTRNVLISSIFLLPGLSYLFIQMFFLGLLSAGIENRVALVTLYSLIFLVTPVFLLGQTVPLVSNYFSSEKLAQITGKMLFCSTVGSFFGAIFSTLVLMNFAGVNNAVNMIFVMLAAIILVITKKKTSGPVLFVLFVAAFGLYVNSPMMMDNFKIVSNNAYNTISITEDETGRHFMMNNNDSSLLGSRGEKHKYVEFVEKHYLAPLAKDLASTPKRILVVGAAGFTFGLEDTKNHYVYIDIDKAVKNVAERDFLKEKLTSNKEFFAEDIRSYLMRQNEKFDLIFLDAYLGGLTIPEYLVTYEFFKQVKEALAPGGVVAGNFIISPNFAGAFSQKLDNTLRAAFPHITRNIVDPDYNGWDTDDSYMVNIIYTFTNTPESNPTDIYTDNKNQISFDKPARNSIRKMPEAEGQEAQP